MRKGVRIMTTYLFYVAFTSFVVVMLIMGLFFITSMWLNNSFKARVDRKTRDYRELIHMHFSNPSNVSDEDIGHVKKLISSKAGLLGFYKVYKEYLDTYGFYEEIRSYNNQVIEFKMLIKNKIVRSKYRKSYILFLMSEFRLNTKEVIEYALDALDSDSIYVRYNALKLIRNSGNTAAFLDALERIMHNKKSFNVRVLVDYMDQFQGNIQLINMKLANNLNNYNGKLKKAAIFHFTNCQYDAPEARNTLLYLLANEVDKGILISIIRYFEKVIDEKAVEHLISKLSNKDWEVRAASARILEKYPSDETISELTKSLMDENYFVRFNSASSLSRMVQGENTIREILSKTDSFGKDSFLYAMSLENSMKISHYIESNAKEVV